MILYQDEYEHFKKEMLAENEKGNFWDMAAEELAIEYLKEAKKEFPELVMYKMGIRQFFCLNDTAQKKVKELVTEEINKKKNEIEELQEVLAKII